MADEKVTALTELTTAIFSDILYVVDDPAGSPVRKKITIEILYKAMFPGEFFLSATGGWPSTTNGASEPTKTEYTTNDIDMYSLDFDQTADEYMQWTVWMPDDWDAGDVTFKPVWTSAAPAGSVYWRLRGRGYSNGDLIDQNMTDNGLEIDTYVTANDVYLADESSALTLSGSPFPGSIVQFRLYRDTADSLTSDARLLGIKIYYTR